MSETSYRFQHLQPAQRHTINRVRPSVVRGGISQRVRVGMAWMLRGAAQALDGELSLSLAGRLENGVTDKNLVTALQFAQSEINSYLGDCGRRLNDSRHLISKRREMALDAIEAQMVEFRNSSEAAVLDHQGGNLAFSLLAWSTAGALLGAIGVGHFKLDALIPVVGFIAMMALLTMSSVAVNMVEQFWLHKTVGTSLKQFYLSGGAVGWAAMLCVVAATMPVP